MPGPWTDQQFQRAQELVKSPGLDAQKKLALEQKIAEYRSVAGAQQASEFSALEEAFKARNSTPALGEGGAANEFNRPSASRPLDGTSLEPVVYIDDPTAQDNDARYAKLFDQATAEGKTVYRLRDMGDDWTSKLMKVGAGARGMVAAGGLGYAKGASAGIVDPGEALDEASGPGRAEELESAHPIANAVGRIFGAVTGLPGRIAGMVAPGGAPAATAAGRLGQSAQAGAKAALVEGAAEEGADMARDPSKTLGEGAADLAGRTALGAGGGAAAGLLGEVGRGLKSIIERGKAGPDLQRVAAETALETKQPGNELANRVRAALGMPLPQIDKGPTTILGGVKTPKSVSEALDRQVASGGKMLAKDAAADEATPLVMKRASDEIGSVRGKVSASQEAYRSSPEGEATVSTEDLVEKISDLMKRDTAEGGKLPFESTSKLGKQLRSLMRVFDDETGEVVAAPRKSGDADEFAASLNVRELDRLIRNIDEASKAGAATSTPGTRELAEIGRVARKLRDQFEPNAIAPEGYSALQAKNSEMLASLGNKLKALGLPDNIKNVDLNDVSQKNMVLNALRRYGQSGNRFNDDEIDALVKSNPEIAKLLRDKTVMDAFRRLSGEEIEDVGSELVQRKYMKPNAVRTRLHALGDTLSPLQGTRNAAKAGVRISPVYGPLEGLFGQKENRK